MSRNCGIAKFAAVNVSVDGVTLNRLVAVAVTVALAPGENWSDTAIVVPSKMQNSGDGLLTMMPWTASPLTVTVTVRVGSPLPTTETVTVSSPGFTPSTPLTVTVCASPLPAGKVSVDG